ncbi:1-phosphofructokinase family hexose kinase [Bacteriovoracaceae bacterium]|nr:1-phosphofructokinase family hexose kinase [Bacteriovoracaceae bacterium]
MDNTQHRLITVTLNPVLDITGEVSKVIPNEKNYVEDERRYPGGNGINVARILNRLDAHCLATGFLGGSIGSELLHLMQTEKLPLKFFPIEDNSRMGITISSVETNQQTRFSFSGPVITDEEFKVLETFLLETSNESIIILGGSFPREVSQEKVSLLFQKLKREGHRCIVDVPGKYLREMTKAKPFLIKPNLIEFQELVNLKVDSIDEVIKAASELKKDVELICISSVEGGALLISKNEIWFGSIPKIKVKTTVGAGDSMVAGMSYMINKSSSIDVKEILRWGLAAACATLITTGTELGHQDKILEFLPQINLKKI